MDKKLQEELKVKLEEERNSIQKELESFASEDPNLKHNWDAKYPNREDGDKDEEADEVQEYDNMLSLEHSLELKLKDVNNALEKITEGKYGICEKCGKEIEEERLKAAPEARFHLKCNGN
ncbi:MAG: TraR/DksA C4-type zinc finger protein [Candidatus Staskawiczbacteria bacterium]|nr:TraR/DksA C4-type zinc finger protein [Candidatus Staskawiczbacteria bacterium]